MAGICFYLAESSPISRTTVECSRFGLGYLLLLGSLARDGFGSFSEFVLVFETSVVDLLEPKYRHEEEVVSIQFNSGLGFSEEVIQPICEAERILPTWKTKKKRDLGPEVDFSLFYNFSFCFLFFFILYYLPSFFVGVCAQNGFQSQS